MEEARNEYSQDSVEKEIADHVIEAGTRELPELFDDESVEAYIANLDDWD